MFRSPLEPYDQLARAENRLDSTGDLAGGIRDAADVVETIAALLDAGAKFIPSDHDAHATVTVETSRLRHAAERLCKAAPGAQKASDQSPAPGRRRGERAMAVACAELWTTLNPRQ
ncbi:hypothetical protein [Streptomyces sp. bgisy159]|uniref:hypothetical protein n=1 Tax=Streptomyces sp. bgisy159 TaxID=3413795 RepID=UPI003F4A0814